MQDATLAVLVTLCDHDGVYLVVDQSAVAEGAEQLLRRTRIICENPANALECIAAVFWPHREFNIEEQTANARPPQH